MISFAIGDIVGFSDVREYPSSDREDQTSDFSRFQTILIALFITCSINKETALYEQSLSVCHYFVYTCMWTIVWERDQYYEIYKENTIICCACLLLYCIVRSGNGSKDNKIL